MCLAESCTYNIPWETRYDHNCSAVPTPGDNKPLASFRRSRSPPGGQPEEAHRLVAAHIRILATWHRRLGSAKGCRPIPASIAGQFKSCRQALCHISANLKAPCCPRFRALKPKQDPSHQSFYVDICLLMLSTRGRASSDSLGEDWVLLHRRLLGTRQQQHSSLLRRWRVARSTASLHRGTHCNYLMHGQELLARP